MNPNKKNSDQSRNQYQANLNNLRSQNSQNNSSKSGVKVYVKNHQNVDVRDTNNASANNSQQNQKVDSKIPEKDIAKSEPNQADNSKEKPIESSIEKQDSVKKLDEKEDIINKKNPEEIDLDQETSQEVARLQAQLSGLEMEKEDWKNKMLRAVADNQNLLKQHQIELQQSSKSTKKNVAKVILHFLNTLHLAFAHIPQHEDEKIHKFIETLRSSFDLVIKDLANSQIEILIPKIGDSFDPQIMSIVSQQEETEGEPVVKQLIGVGLKVDGHVVQPAMIIV